LAWPSLAASASMWRWARARPSPSIAGFRAKTWPATCWPCRTGPTRATSIASSTADRRPAGLACRLPLWKLGRPQVEGRDVYWRDLDLDLGRVGVDGLIQPIGHRARPEDDDDDQNDLQRHPGDGSPIDLRGFDGRWRDAAQVEQGKAERRV